jgi:hypothetical protein
MDKGKKGAVLTLALLVMFVGTIILGGLFMYLDTSMLLATKGEENAVSYYASDSGVEDAILWLQQGQPDEDYWSCGSGNNTCNRSSYTINNRTVEVTVEKDPGGYDEHIYRINSSAFNGEIDAKTEIISYVRTAPLDLSLFGEDAITSNCDCETCPPGGLDSSIFVEGTEGGVNGSIRYVCDYYCQPNCDTVVGPKVQEPDGIPWWPDTELLKNLFLGQVDTADPFTCADCKTCEINSPQGDYCTLAVPDNCIELDVSKNPTIGPLYRDGDLHIMSSLDCPHDQPEPPATCAQAKLEGTIYITGDLFIRAGKHPFTLNLSGNTIFVEGSIFSGVDWFVAGSGSIIALNCIEFKPKIVTDEAGYLFIMSAEGDVYLLPEGDFYGSIAGYNQVYVKPETMITYADPDAFGYELPGSDEIALKILTYDIIDQ